MFTARWLRADSATESLSPAQSSVLATLERTGAARPGDLAAAEALNPTMLSRVIGHLERRGLVRRDPDPDDGRACLVSATREGRTLVRRLRAHRRTLVGDRLDELPDEYVQQLIDALPALEALARRPDDTRGRRR